MRKIIVGLGNPAISFYQSGDNPDFQLLKRLQAAGRFHDIARTRHNAGFAVLNLMAPHAFRFDATMCCNIADVSTTGDSVKLIQPMNGMNTSGTIIKAVLDHFALSAADLLLVYDDISLPLGVLRFRQEGTSGGHRGVQSVIEQIGPRFDRLKVGVGPLPPNANVVDFVLSTMPEEICSQYGNAIAAAAEKCIAWAASFNT